MIILNKEHNENQEREEPDEINDLEDIELDREEVEFDIEEEEKVPKVSLVPKVSDEPLETPVEAKKTRTLPKFLKRALPHKKLDVEKAGQSTSCQQLNSPTATACCHPFVEKLKTMADKQLHKAKHAIKKQRDDEPQPILKLKESPKADRKEIASYVVKQDSDDVLEIMDLDESPSEVRRNRDDERSTIVCPDEIIELPIARDNVKDDDKDAESIEPTATEILEAELKSTPPAKSPRKLKEHVYEEIEQKLDEPPENDPAIDEFISRLSLLKEDEQIAREPADQDSDENVLTLRPLSTIESETEEEQIPSPTLFAPISHGNEKRAVSEEKTEEAEKVAENIEIKPEEIKEPELKSVLKREASPSTDKKVTFSMSTEDNSDEPHREDVDLPEHVKVNSKWSKMR